MGLKNFLGKICEEETEKVIAKQKREKEKTSRSFSDQLRLMSDQELKRLLQSGTLSVATGAMAAKELNRRGYKHVGEVK